MNVDSINLFYWNFLSFNIAVIIKLNLNLFLIDFKVIIFNIESQRWCLDWNFCFYTVVFFIAWSDLIILIIINKMKKNENSLKVVVVIVVVINVRFLLSFDLF